MLIVEIKPFKTNESTMKKYILLFCLALHSTHTLVSSHNQPTNSQQTDSQETQLDDDAIAWLFSSRNPDNQHQGQIIYLHNASQQEAQANDGHGYHDEDNYNDGFPNIFHQPTPPNNNQLNHHDNNQFQDFFDQITQPNSPIARNNQRVVPVVSQEETQNAPVLQRAEELPHNNRLPYTQYHHDAHHVVSQETENSSQDQ